MCLISLEKRFENLDIFLLFMIVIPISLIGLEHYFAKKKIKEEKEKNKFNEVIDLRKIIKTIKNKKEVDKNE